jgi:hypothetical protein
LQKSCTTGLFFRCKHAADTYSAEQAKALVDAYATEHEKASLDFSAMSGAGVRLG